MISKTVALVLLECHSKYLCRNATSAIRVSKCFWFCSKISCSRKKAKKLSPNAVFHNALFIACIWVLHGPGMRKKLLQNLFNPNKCIRKCANGLFLTFANLDNSANASSCGLKILSSFELESSNYKFWTFFR